MFQWLPDVTLQQFLLRTVAICVVVMVQGVTTAFLLRLRGDDGPWFDGRWSLNPARHIDLLGYIAAVFTGMGWMRPLEHDVRRLRRPLADGLSITLASAALLFAVAILARFLRPVVIGTIAGDAGIALALALATISSTAAGVGALSLVPLPPFVAVLVLDAVVRGWPSVHSVVMASWLRLTMTVVFCVALVSGALVGPIREIANALLSLV